MSVHGDEAPVLGRDRRLEFDGAIARILKGSLTPEGGISVGLSKTGELGLLEYQKIPLPRNLHAFDASRASHILYLAHKSAEVYETMMPESMDREGMDWLRASVQFAILTGNVAFTPAGSIELPQTAAALRALAWDSDVRIVDEDWTPPAGEMEDEEIRDWVPGSLEVPSRVIALVVAAKLTWWTTGHHLGVKMGESARKSAKTRKFYGYTEKVAQSLGEEKFNMSEDESQSRVHALTHPWSTKGVWGALWRDKNTPTRPLRVQSVPLVHRSTHAGAFIPLEFCEDVTMRLDTFGAGWATLSDLMAALRMMSTSALYIHNPGLGEVVPLCERYLEVKRDILAYGLPSHYLTGSNQPPRFDKDQFARITAALTCYVKHFLEGTTIARATPFLTIPEEMFGYDAGWNHMCQAGKIAYASQLKSTPEALVRLFEATGHTAANTVPAGLVAAMNEAGMHVSEYQFLKSICAFAGRDPPTRPASPAAGAPPPPHNGPGGGGGPRGPRGGPPGGHGGNGGQGGPPGSGGGTGGGSNTSGREEDRDTARESQGGSREGSEDGTSAGWAALPLVTRRGETGGAFEHLASGWSEDHKLPLTTQLAAEVAHDEVVHEEQTQRGFVLLFKPVYPSNPKPNDSEVIKGRLRALADRVAEATTTAEFDRICEEDIGGSAVTSLRNREECGRYITAGMDGRRGNIEQCMNINAAKAKLEWLRYFEGEG